MSRGRVVKVTHVPLPATLTRPPERVELSFFDALWMSIPPIQRLLLFHGTHLPPLPALLDSLRASLSRTLLHYFTLAGKLTYLPASGNAFFIDCSPAAVGPGVAFLEAEADGADLSHLVNDEAHDVKAFGHLVPTLDIEELPAPVFAVQVTAFAGAEGVTEGAAVGFAFHHAIADGRAIWEFVKAWAAECSGENPRPPPPTVDRAVIKHPRGDEIRRSFLSNLAPSLPKTEVPSASHASNLERRTLVVSPQRIQLLKQRAMVEPPPSTFVSILAHAWISSVHSKAPDRRASTYAIFVADCRAYLDPPILPQQNYFGNCVKICLATAVAGDLTEEEEGGHAQACRAIQRAMRESSLEDPLADCGTGWLKTLKGMDLSQAVIVAASPRFALYEVDFGWGGPSRVELVSMNHEGHLALAKAKDGDGVQLSVALRPLHIQAFVERFMGDMY